MKKVCIIGYGEIGQALHHLLKPRITRVTVWDRVKEKRTDSEPLETLVASADIVILAVPSWSLREVINDINEALHSKALVIYVSKGIDPDTQKFPYEMIQSALSQPVVKLAGPMLAEEIMEDQPCGAVCAGSRSACATVRELFEERLQLTNHAGLRDVDCAGALKNIYALYFGVLQQLGYGSNVMGMQSLKIYQEMKIITELLQCDPRVIDSYAGYPDFFATACSTHSSNKEAGASLMRGEYVMCESLQSLKALERMLGTKIQKIPILALLVELTHTQRVAQKTKMVHDFVQKRIA